jgi:hypothetical protein
MKKITILLTFLLYSLFSTGQVSSYTFSQAAGTYAPITGGTLLASSTVATTLDSEVYGALQIGFTFSYNGIDYTTFGLNVNGWISMGSTLPTSSSTPISSGSTPNVVSAISGDLYGRQFITASTTLGSPIINMTAGSLLGVSVGDAVTGTGMAVGATVLSITGSNVTLSANASSTGTGRNIRFHNGTIRYETIGTAPNRTLVLQFNKFSRWATSAPGDFMNFQIRLNETSNTINVVYDIPYVNALATRQVGLRGATSADFNNRSTTTNWAATTAGGSNTESCTLSNTIFPVSGLTYSFTPPAVSSAPNCATAHVPADLATNIARNPILTWTAPTSPGASSYDVYFGNSTNPALIGNQTDTSYVPGLLVANTTYYWKIVPKNNIGSSVGCIERSFTTGTSVTYCNSTYTNGPGTTDGITNVTLGALNNTTSQNNVSPFYTFYNAVTIPNIQQGATASLSVTYGSDINQWGGAWIDFNQNGLFDAAEGVVSTVNAGANGTSVLTFSVPVGAVVGNTRMRVRGGNDSALTTAQACGASSSTYGETEDYIVNITPQPTDLPDYVNLQFPATATIAASNTATIYGQVYEAGLTDVAPNIVGQAPGIEAWVGISPIGQNTNPNTWTTFVPATWNSGNVSNNDEYQANIGANLPVGTYYYATRFRLNGGAFRYGGTDGTNGNFWDGTTFNSGVLTVTANPSQCATIIAPANNATNVPNGTVNFSWAAPTTGATPTSYEFYGGTTSGALPLVATITTTNININITGFNTVFYWRVVPISAGGGAAVGCPEWTFTTGASPFAPYCAGAANAYTSGVEPITLVNFAGINNSSSAVLGGSGHESFTSIVGNTNIGQSYTMTLKGNTDGAFTDFFTIYIDFNQDGDFLDAGETFPGGTIINSTGLDAVQAVSQINIPTSATLGNTRMRITKLFNGATASACSGGGFGQSEDYTLNISSPCATIATWNGTTWSATPSATTALVFDGDYSGAGLAGCSATVNAGRTVTITSGTLDLQNYVEVLATGVLNIESGANLLQTNIASVNTGSVNIKQISAPMVRLDYTAWSSPVVAQKLKAFSPQTLDVRFYTYSPVTNAYVVVANPVTADFATGKGYLIRSSDVSSPSVAVAHNGLFAGVPVNGSKTTAVTAGFNLVGNPYASKLDATLFLNNSTNSGLGITTLHFWSNTVAAVGGVYATNNYASFNAMGGTASASNSQVPNGIISVGQGFFVNPTSAGNATFLNTMRSTAASTQFFKSSSVVNTPSDKHRFWLNLATPTTANNQILIGYTADASNDFDAKYDAALFGNTASVIYSKVADYKLAIQGRSSFATTDVLPLGLQATDAGQFTISLADFDGLFVSQNIFLKDNALNTIQNLKLGSYTFNAAQGEFASRFEVVFDSSLLSTNSNVFNDASVIVIKNNNGISIETGNNTIDKVAIYDIRGRLLLTKTNINASTVTLNNVATANQVLIVKITNTNNQTVIKKVVN